MSDMLGLEISRIWKYVKNLLFKTPVCFFRMYRSVSSSIVLLKVRLFFSVKTLVKRNVVIVVVVGSQRVGYFVVVHVKR